jgi:hypothetical protein
MKVHKIKIQEEHDLGKYTLEPGDTVFIPMKESGTPTDMVYPWIGWYQENLEYSDKKIQNFMKYLSKQYGFDFTGAEIDDWAYYKVALQRPVPINVMREIYEQDAKVERGPSADEWRLSSKNGEIMFYISFMSEDRDFISFNDGIDYIDGAYMESKKKHIKESFDEDEDLIEPNEFAGEDHIREVHQRNMEVFALALIDGSTQIINGKKVRIEVNRVDNLQFEYNGVNVIIDYDVEDGYLSITTLETMDILYSERFDYSLQRYEISEDFDNIFAITGKILAKELREAVIGHDEYRTYFDDFKSIEDVKRAVERGKDVYWQNRNYKVIKDKIGQWLVWSQMNDHYVGLHEPSYPAKEFFTEGRKRIKESRTFDFNAVKDGYILAFDEGDDTARLTGNLSARANKYVDMLVTAYTQNVPSNVLAEIEQAGFTGEEYGREIFMAVGGYLGGFYEMEGISEESQEVLTDMMGALPFAWFVQAGDEIDINLKRGKLESSMKRGYRFNEAVGEVFPSAVVYSDGDYELAEEILDDMFGTDGRDSWDDFDGEIEWEGTSGISVSMQNLSLRNMEEMPAIKNTILILKLMVLKDISTLEIVREMTL